MEYISTKIWFKSELELQALGSLIEEMFQLQPFYYDAENLYEWGEAEAPNGLWKIDVSRKHREGEPQPSEFYHILFNGSPPLLDRIAEQIAKMIKGEVYLGYIIYEGGDDYSFKVISCYQG